MRVGGGEFARDAVVETSKSASEPKSAGVSGRLFDDKLCRRERDLSAPVVTDGAVLRGRGTSGLGVSTTRRIRAWRGAGESEAREAAVSGVLGRELTTDADPATEANVPEIARSPEPYSGRLDWALPQ
jgi:hypothetical protein